MIGHQGRRRDNTDTHLNRFKNLKHGELWRRQRKTASYEFASKNIRDFSIVVFREYSLKLSAILSQASFSIKEVDMHERHNLVGLFGFRHMNPASAFVGLLLVVGIGGITLVIESTTLSAVVTSIERKNLVKYGKLCGVCKGKGFYMCKLCKASGTIKWSPLHDPVAINPCRCPTCNGNFIQCCLNCLGVGYA